MDKNSKMNSLYQDIEKLEVLAELIHDEIIFIEGAALIEENSYSKKFDLPIKINNSKRIFRTAKVLSSISYDIMHQLEKKAKSILDNNFDESANCRQKE